MTDPAVTVSPMQALEEKKDWSRALATSTLLPKDYIEAPANLLLAAEYADTLGVPRMAALTGINVIHGKPSMSADLMLALVRRAGHRVRVSGDDEHATAQLNRADDPDFTYEATWTLDKARKAGLLEQKGRMWERYPAAMLRARAITEVARTGASEVLFGAIYTPEELGAIVDETGAPIAVTTEPAAPEQTEHAEEVHAVLMADQELLDEIHDYASDLGLTEDQINATARYCGAPEASLEGLTAKVAIQMADYLKERRDEATAGQASAQEDEEIIEGVIIEEGPEGEQE